MLHCLISLRHRTILQYKRIHEITESWTFITDFSEKTEKFLQHLLIYNFTWVLRWHFLSTAWAQVWGPVPEGSIKTLSLTAQNYRTECVTLAICLPGSQQLTQLIDRNQHIWTRACVCVRDVSRRKWLAISNTRVAPQGTLNKVRGNLVSRGRVYSYRAQLLTGEKDREEAWSFLVVIEYLCFLVYLFFIHFH